MPRIVLFVVIIFTSFLTSTVYADPPLPTPIGRVVWVNGTLKAVMPNKEERVLQKTSLIFLQDTLITDNKSTAEIVFTDNTLMSFRPNTTYRIEEYQYNSKSKSQSIGKFISTLIEGGFRTITGIIAKENPDEYKLKTPVATIGVRGTDYETLYRKGSLSLAYIKGKPCMTAQEKTLCLDKTIPYGGVAETNAVPVILKTIPDELKVRLKITPATIAPFETKSGTISSFCITS